MYIRPDTIIRILKNVPLDMTYNHTIYWDSADAQVTYFTGKAKHSLSNQSYQRIEKGLIRVGIPAEQLYDCNYLMFQNKAFGSKWFYAFIQSVEYINNAVSEIAFVIDVIQTWWFDFELGESFVVREHAGTDTVGSNTVPENLEQGPYVVASSGAISFGGEEEDTTGILVVTTFKLDGQLGDPWISGVFSGLNYAIYSASFATDLQVKLDQWVSENNADGVVGIWMVPFGNWAKGSALYTAGKSLTKLQGSFDGYTPKNKKLYTYPYNLLHIYTNQGSADFRYELFSGSSCGFTLYGGVAPEPSISLVPDNYAGISGHDRESRLTITGFPQCAYVSDAYKRYVAANASSLPLRMVGLEFNRTVAGVSTIANVAGNAATGNISGAISAGARGAVDLYSAQLAIDQEVARLSDIQSKPPQMNGSQSGSIDFAMNAQQFRYKKLKIRGEYAKIIDEYFTMFGYATHRVKIPNTNSRERWTYTKTAGCVVTGSVPCDDMATICKIFDNGITFWKNPAEIGNYSLSNQPTGEG